MTLKSDGVYFKMSIFIVVQKLHLLQLLKHFICSKRCKGYAVLNFYFREETSKILQGVCEVREDIFLMLESQ